MRKTCLFKFAIVHKSSSLKIGWKTVPANSLAEAAETARKTLLKNEEIQLSCVTAN